LVPPASSTSSVSDAEAEYSIREVRGPLVDIAEEIDGLRTNWQNSLFGEKARGEMSIASFCITPLFLQTVFFHSVLLGNGFVAGDTANVQRIKRIFTSEDFKKLFPKANGYQVSPKPFNYANFLAAAAKFEKFCDEAAGGLDLDTACRKELSVSFAHFTQETGENTGWGPVPRWKQGLYFTSELGCKDSLAACSYCSPSTEYPCVAGKGYFGRGALQLSWNFNYGPFSEAIYGDKSKLLNDPDSILTAENGVLAFASAIWFLMTPQMPKPAIHDIVVGKWQPTAADKAGGRYPGFGVTTLIINGGLECSKTPDQRALNRIAYYKNFTAYFNVAPGGYLSCSGMKPF
ncbi:hypothetical protein FOZ62_026873, partial [Perkinsus olseni]